MANDLPSFVEAVWAELPRGQFPRTGQIVGAVVNAIATIATLNFQQASYVKGQANVTTAEGMNLDMLSVGMFGPGTLPRRSGEADEAFAGRIEARYLQPTGTLAALVTRINDLTGSDPVVFCPCKDGMAADVDFVCDLGGKLGEENEPGVLYIDVSLPSGPGFNLPGADVGCADVNFCSGDVTLFESQIATSEVVSTILDTILEEETVFLRTWTGPIPADA